MCHTLHTAVVHAVAHILGVDLSDVLFMEVVACERWLLGIRIGRKLCKKQKPLWVNSEKFMPNSITSYTTMLKGIFCKSEPAMNVTNKN